MKKYETPKFSSLTIAKEDVLNLSVNQGVLLENDIQGASWEG